MKARGRKRPAIFWQGPQQQHGDDKDAIDATAQATSAATTTFGGPNGSIVYEIDRKENRAIQKPLTIIQSTLERYNNNNSHEKKKNGRKMKISLADAIALGGAVAIESVGGPYIPIQMGRMDVTTADNEYRLITLSSTTLRSIVDRTLPSPGLDSMGIRLFFCTQYGLNLTEEEMVALCGIHGVGKHVSLLGMSKECLKHLSRDCLETAPILLPFVTSSVNTFNNEYYKMLLKWNTNDDIELGQVAFIPTDVTLVVDNGLQKHVKKFATNYDYFCKVFARAYQKLVDTTATTNQLY